MIGLIGIILSLVLLIYLAYLGINVRLSPARSSTRSTLSVTRRSLPHFQVQLFHSVSAAMSGGTSRATRSGARAMSSFTISRIGWISARGR